MTIYAAPSIYRSMSPRTAAAVRASIASNPTTERVIDETLWNDALIARSRSLLATKFLDETDADVMVIYDDDIVWNPADFWKLVEGARETRGIYCGPYVTKAEKPHIASRCFPDTMLELVATPQRRPIEIQYAATGFVAIHRDVFEAMVDHRFDDADGGHTVRRVERGAGKPFIPFFATFTVQEPDGAYHYLSEDWAFCERARQLGFGVWMDQSIILEHMGWYAFTVADLNAPVGLPSTGTDLVEVEGCDRLTGDHLLDSLIADIAEWADEDEGDTRRMVAAATATLARLWETKPATEQEQDWYLRDDVGMAYVGDLANWHLHGGGTPRALAPWLRGLRVLDYGAGIGTTALLAAREGAESVTAWEPNPVLREFIGWRAKKHGLDVTVPSVLWETGQFDVVVCWHVFEHVGDPERELAHIVRLLRDDGALITESDFHCDDGHPMHHERDDWQRVLARWGFVRQGNGPLYRLQGALVGAAG